MQIDAISRRSLLKQFGSAAVAAGLLPGLPMQSMAQAGSATDPEQASRMQRMQWWHAAKFGMFIHWGLYSVLGQHEWAMEIEGIPIPQYEQLAANFHPKRESGPGWRGARGKSTWS
jgi:alpha-L-fucosidase